MGNISQYLEFARYTVEQAGASFELHDRGSSHLTRLRLLKPLGHPPANGTKYYAAVYIERLCRDEAWLALTVGCPLKIQVGQEPREGASRRASRIVQILPASCPTTGDTGGQWGFPKLGNLALKTPDRTFSRKGRRFFTRMPEGRFCRKEVGRMGAKERLQDRALCTGRIKAAI